MEALATPILKSIDDAIADRLADLAETERKRLEAEAEQNRLNELGKEAFYEALVERIAHDYGIDIRPNRIEITYSHSHGIDAQYSFALSVDAQPAAAGVEVEAWISLKWAESAAGIRDKKRRDTIWITRRRAFFDGPENDPVTLFYEFNNLVDALVMGKTGIYK